jgi:hypothetical protein
VTRENTSPGQQSQAPIRPSRARFATQSATRFDLGARTQTLLAGTPETRGLARGFWLSRPGARCQGCSRSVSPGRSPNPPCRSPGNGLSTVSAVRRSYAIAQGLGILLPRYRCRVTGTLAMLGGPEPRPTSEMAEVNGLWSAEEPGHGEPGPAVQSEGATGHVARRGREQKQDRSDHLRHAADASHRHPGQYPLASRARHG